MRTSVKGYYKRDEINFVKANCRKKLELIFHINSCGLEKSQKKKKSWHLSSRLIEWFKHFREIAFWLLSQMFGLQQWLFKADKSIVRKCVEMKKLNFDNNDTVQIDVVGIMHLKMTCLRI